jgi:hypothetical protein
VRAKQGLQRLDAEIDEDVDLQQQQVGTAAAACKMTAAAAVEWQTRVL